VGNAAHAELDDILRNRELPDAKNPRGVVKVAFRAIPSVKMGVNVNDGELDLEGPNDGKGDAVVASKNDGKGFPGKNGFDRLGDLGVGLFSDRWIDEHIPDIDPMPSFQDGAVSIDVVKALSQIVAIFLRILEEVARAVTFTWLSPSTLIEGNAENGEVCVGWQLGQVRLIRRAEKSTDADEGWSGLAESRCSEAHGRSENQKRLLCSEE